MPARRLVWKPVPRLHLAGGRAVAWVLLWAYLLATAWMPLAHAARAHAEQLPVVLCSAHGTGVMIIPLSDPGERKRVEQSMSAPACCGACVVMADIAPTLDIDTPNAPALLGSVSATDILTPHLATPAPQRRARGPPLG
ncbi:DUF2946 domain-containing protein [Ralstonia insidiosa]|jgi:hypothetical protein|nr:DUF2946 domain-containing protein [Ralstonia insidiosa]MBA9872839.1 DUF2946 domain-containing protein [Ralstonia insidiosa]MBA9916034.1 DUF2946 domain-containing protein [Ralstonia insidiosa]MBA9939583.1 DUF2946 domain-containing protein [Ralstonia insidiosa]MBA9955031.1 DUF2946 domain-containing protein [Ralstonia insidiosa]